MTEEPISMDKEYTTLDGTPVRIYATDAGDDEFPVHAAYYENGQWWQVSYTRYGQLSTNGLDYAVDLIEKPKTHKIVRYMNVYPEGVASTLWTSRDYADQTAEDDRIACVRIEIDVEEGRFDE